MNLNHQLKIFLKLNEIPHILKKKHLKRLKIDKVTAS